MALLRLSTGKLYTTHEEISPRIGTVRIGKFNYPDEFRREVEKLATPLTEEGAEFVTSRLDPAAIALPNAEGLVHRRVGSVVPQSDGGFVFAFGKTAADATPRQMSEEQMRAYLMPHIVDAVDWHFVLAGGIVKGLDLGDHQGVLYVQAGEWICLNPKVVNWPIFPNGQSTIGVSYFNKEPGTFGQVEYPDVKILPEMRY